MTKNKIIYLDEEQRLVDRLDVESTMATLFKERVEAYGKQVRSSSKVGALLLTLGVSSWFLYQVSNSLYVQGLSDLPTLTRFIVSGLNLLVFGFVFTVGYLVAYHTLKTFRGVSLFSKGEYFERKDSTFMPLHYKVDRGYYVDLYFNSNGYTSKVSVSPAYASLYEVGSRVPVMVDVLMYKGSGKVRVVSACVGSRADNLDDYRQEMEAHFAQTEAEVTYYQELERKRLETMNDYLAIATNDRWKIGG